MRPAPRPRGRGMPSSLPSQLSCRVYLPIPGAMADAAFAAAHDARISSRALSVRTYSRQTLTYGMSALDLQCGDPAASRHNGSYPYWPAFQPLPDRGPPGPHLHRRYDDMSGPGGPQAHVNAPSPARHESSRLGPERGRACLVDFATVRCDRHGVVALGACSAHHAVAHVAQHAGRVTCAWIAIAAAARRERTIGAGPVPFDAVFRRLDALSVGQGEDDVAA